MLIALFTLLGLVVGQFLVWCADRLPAGRSLLVRAPSDDAADSSWPAVLGWAAGGRPRLRSLLLILLTAAGFGFLAARFGPQLYLPFVAAYWSIPLLVAVIDLEHKLIFNRVVFPAVLLALLGALVTGRPTLLAAVLGAVAGFLALFVVFLLGGLFVMLVSRRRKINEVAFGAGDVKLAIFIGLITGLPDVAFALMIGIVLGGVGGMIYLIWKSVRRQYSAFTAVPYGPYLVIGALAMLFYGPEIIRWYIAG